jgi:hypothetical protein
MQKKTKIQILVGATLGVFLIGVFFYFYKSSGSKKVELNLAQNSEEQKNVEENVDNQDKIIQDEISDTPEKVESIVEDNEAVNPPSESKKDIKVVDKPSTIDTDDTEVPKITKLSIANRLVSWGFQADSGRKIDTIIIHSSYDALGNDPYSVGGVIAEYKEYEVSPHYLIDRTGKVYRLVEDKNIAYHAGESKMPDGRTGVNNFSIGIEMLTTKKDKLTDAQYSALKLLIADLKGKHKITNVLGHNQIAPGRKDDPWNFEWGKLK